MPEAKALIKTLQADNKLQYLFQETQYDDVPVTGRPIEESSHGESDKRTECIIINPYPTAFPYGNGMVLHFYQQQESSTTKTVHKVINKGLKTYV